MFCFLEIILHVYCAASVLGDGRTLASETVRSLLGKECE